MTGKWQVNDSKMAVLKTCHFYRLPRRVGFSPCQDVPAKPFDPVTPIFNSIPLPLSLSAVFLYIPAGFLCFAAGLLKRVIVFLPVCVILNSIQNAGCLIMFRRNLCRIVILSCLPMRIMQGACHVPNACPPPDTPASQLCRLHPVSPRRERLWQQ